MRILELLCNPRPASFNHALAARIRSRLGEAGHEVLFHDLCEEGFDPVMSAEELGRGISLDPVVQRYYRELSEAEGLILLHPDWWGGPPAVLKGWIDRVFRQGIVYDLAGEDFTRKAMSPLLGGMPSLVLCTTDDAEPEAALHLERLWSTRVLGPCGAKVDCRVLPNIRATTPADRAAWFELVDARLESLFPAAVPRRSGPRAQPSLPIA
ncbi:MAG TPA: NAD(P)H-dependent oxidoreductase [Rectinemataceae bacterium]|nr:NAD(P)H-dependent oxidoreductase [Rectinemataceae bacterium]